MKAIFPVDTHFLRMIKIKTAPFLSIYPLARLLVPLGLAVVTACSTGESEFIPEVEDIEIDLSFRRFEKDLFRLDTNANFETELVALEESYGEFGKIYFDNVLGSRNSDALSVSHEKFVRGFITFPFLRSLYDTMQVVYQSTEDIEDDFKQAFQFYKFYFPDNRTPTVTTFLSEFSYQAFIYGTDELAVGLDLFLGEQYPYQEIDPYNPNFSSYLTRTYNRDHLVPKTLLPLVQDLVGPPRGNHMLDEMIQKGKELYLLDHLLPYHPDTVIMEVSSDQWAWLEKNEQDIWAFFLNESDLTTGQNLLYSTDWASYRKFIEYSPNSPGMPDEAPGRTACFIGWKIVDSWMKRTGNEGNIKLLLSQTDAQQLFTESRYKPKRRS